jgi:hypothetical protein
LGTYILILNTPLSLSPFHIIGKYILDHFIE